MEFLCRDPRSLDLLAAIMKHRRCCQNQKAIPVIHHLLCQRSRSDSPSPSLAASLTYSTVTAPPTVHPLSFYDLCLSPSSFPSPDILHCTMTLAFIPAAVRDVFLCRQALLRYALAWTFLLTAAVAVTSFAPEIAFVWAVTPSPSFARACRAAGGGASALRVPMEGPAGEAVCIPAQLFGRSKVDLFVPLLFAALVVGGSACLVRAVGLWEAEDEEIG